MDLNFVGTNLDASFSPSVFVGTKELTLISTSPTSLIVHLPILDINSTIVTDSGYDITVSFLFSFFLFFFFFSFFFFFFLFVILLFYLMHNF